MTAKVARGGALMDRPRWVRSLAIAVGSSRAAMIFEVPPHWGPCSILSTAPQKKGNKRMVNIWAMLYQGVPYGPQNESYPFAQS
jgi:hypothetical protein